jgi:hypothetical protein
MQELWRMLAAGELNAVQRQWFSPRPAEMLFDTQNDPHEINNLAENPDYFDELQRLREAYKAHRTRVQDLSDKSEAYMAERFWPDGVEPITAIPNLQVENSMLTVTCSSEGASIGYRLNGSRWQLYTDPLPLLIGDKIEVKAVRYGWAESEIAKFNF